MFICVFYYLYIIIENKLHLPFRGETEAPKTLLLPLAKLFHLPPDLNLFKNLKLQSCIDYGKHNSLMCYVYDKR